MAERSRFPIPLKEPLVPLMKTWVENTQEGFLFPSSYKPLMPLSRSWAYHLVRDIDAHAPEDLRKKLGFKRLFTKEGVKLPMPIYCWCHWFRSQRASQLVNDYGFRLFDLLGWFSWEHAKTAQVYAQRGWKSLADKMQIQVKERLYF